MKHKLIELVEKSEERNEHPEFRSGDTIKVHYKVREGEKERIQVFQGLVLAKNNKNFIVRKVSLGVGIERIIPVQSPYIDKIEVVKRGRVRRARLFYLRGKQGKAAKVKEAKVTH